MKPTVMLIGDSIRIGYEPFVREALAGVAEVVTPEGNHGHSTNILMHMHLWILNRQPAPALVHINSGLHDVKTIFYGSREPLIPLEFYRRNVHTLLATIQQRTPSKIIFALTTPVRDENAHREHARWNDFDRFDQHVQAYNAAAREVCGELGVPVNDLYAVAMSAGLDRVQHPDGVHFLEEGSRLLAAATSTVIAEALNDERMG